MSAAAALWRLLPSAAHASRSSSRVVFAQAHSKRYASSDAKPFDKILIANRGEIACRVIRSCKKLGISTVAVHSDVDAEAMHVRMADEKFLLGPAPSAESYLREDRIIEAIQLTGAQAVHPGYGFLSENKHFAMRLQELGVAFIGPNAHAIEIMGDKIESKICAENAGVNIIPGYSGVVNDADHAVEIANQIGYPVMIKASAGGGGKGMRVAWNDKETREGFRMSSQEAKASFGDDRLLIEKFIDEPRHIEIQVLADTHGNTVYLNERECSIQRRNQKVIEEAPSTFLDEATRKAMGEQACALARAVDYVSAGTVEFLVDSQRNFYFCEMNTRLQVEHPVTEMITGVDLVEEMIHIAAGKPMSVTQDDIGINGWAIESRVYAEDPAKYLPSTGLLTHYREPETGNGVRVDSGVFEGGEISMFYDPMICKLITHGKDRTEALKLMNNALDSYVIRGVKHNIPLLRELYAHPRFIAGDTTTKFLEEEYPNGFTGHTLTAKETEQVLAAVTEVYYRQMLYKQRIYNVSNLPETLFYSEDLVISINGTTHRVLGHLFEDALKLEHEGEEIYMDAIDWRMGDPVFRAAVDGNAVTLQVEPKGPGKYTIIHHGTPYDVQVRTEVEEQSFKIFPEKPKKNLDDMILTPMPGTLVSLNVKEGDTVVEGQEVAVVEAMKMQNQLRAPRAGKIAKIHFKTGDTLDDEEVIIEFEPEDTPEDTKAE
ncbi:propionyl Coenzyme A carboxylase [Salpingoeca rosetta]|uniref:Propionyl-CoA carboxylase alpha chain, mitochondrial n=1 Tax=Salpingoeca rosetta (strain ATCC 50818 / BSB-021) TaxID=946362 RepID=F2U0X4_SALR5|nr:propionyl Coenzyme A carboxylase [Salpingoeca rosetta]EGD80548.1 propionyl Coenzyme A carboxylase [Salpingoeca rosetta]|eukprot:XP_004997109.1 propionyl Coenzyme A carboxylase [Salpingoeca rosetta]